MKIIVVSLLVYISTWLRTHRSMRIEIVALRHQLSVYQRSVRRPIIEPEDRVIWPWIARRWSGWKEALIIVQPRTVMAWQRKRFRAYWTKLSRAGKVDRPALSKEVRALIVRMSKSNPGLGSPRIVGELQKLGIQVAKSAVEKYRVRCRKPPSPTWKAFIDNHLKDLVSIDFFTVSTVKFKVLFVLIVLAHHRRKVIYFNVTEHPTSQWTAQQIVEAFPWDTAPRYLLRDRDKVYGTDFRKRVRSLDIEEILTAPRSPWQSPYVERTIGSIGRECLDNVIILNERHLKRVISNYLDYYRRWRTHLSLEMDAPDPRPIQGPEIGRVVELPEVGGLHHHYERLAA
ncbi:MAG: transposase family protein [Gammaproteobacteria bacterium]|nr:transposase family protein [Gammaproteobacteria bacterium]